jgi:CRISPR-associated protein Cmr2
VCAEVWSRFVAPAAESGHGTREIWKRQVENFWELSWVIAAPGERGALARRKQWRSQWPPDEPGDRCSLMSDLQELSGFCRATESRQQNEFWENLESAGRLGRFDLERDRLSAVALVKRLYPKVAEKALGWRLDRDQLSWPSTSDIAASRWCRRVLETAPEQARDYAQTVERHAPGSSPGGVLRLLGSVRPADRDFARLEAAWLYRSFVEGPAAALQVEESGRRELARLLEELGNLQDRDGRLGGPPSYFAILLADGDRLGERIAASGAETVSRALARFTARAPEIAEEHRGVTVYAGGDDVLALLPLDLALPCARALERAYRESFAAAVGRPDHGASLSAAVVFAHVHAPLGQALREAHRLLDAVAKEANGRDSLAVGIHRSSGPAAQWVSTWRPEGEGDAVERVEAVAAELAAGDLSSSLLERLRLSLGLLTDNTLTGVGAFRPVAPGIELEPFVRAEVAHSLLHDGKGRDGADDRVGRAAQVAEKVARLLSRARSGCRDEGEVGLDGLLIAKLLAGGGNEEEHWR